MGSKISLLYTEKVLFVAISIIVPVLVYVSSIWTVRKLGGNSDASRYSLLIACILFFVSWYLPSPLIEGQNTSFTTHFVGGGLFVSFLWLYFKRAFRWRSAWWLEGFSLFALVSALGSVNELFELLAVKVGLTNILLTDTNWDILANSLGALAVFIGYLLYDSRNR